MPARLLACFFFSFAVRALVCFINFDRLQTCHYHLNLIMTVAFAALYRALLLLARVLVPFDVLELLHR